MIIFCIITWGLLKVQFLPESSDSITITLMLFVHAMGIKWQMTYTEQSINTLAYRRMKKLPECCFQMQAHQTVADTPSYNDMHHQHTVK